MITIAIAQPVFTSVVKKAHQDLSVWRNSISSLPSKDPLLLPPHAPGHFTSFRTSRALPYPQIPEHFTSLRMHRDTPPSSASLGTFLLLTLSPPLFTPRDTSTPWARPGTLLFPSHVSEHFSSLRTPRNTSPSARPWSFNAK